MAKRGFILICVVIVCMSFCLSALAMESRWMEVLSNRYTQPDEPFELVTSVLDTTDFELVAQTEIAQLWLNRNEHTIRMVDTRSGYIWGAIPLTDARNLNASWRSYAASIVSIECFDSKYNEKRYGMLDNAQVVYRLAEDGFAFDAYFEALGIRFSGSVRLQHNALSCQIVPDSFREEGDFLLKSLVFSPYLGSVYGDEVPGWFLLPDGPGALMRFRQSGSYISGYDKRIYGKDLSVDTINEAQSLNANRPNDYLLPENQVLIPVFGIAHGIEQHGLLVVVENGAEYASIVATPAGLGNTRYNSIMARFEYRQKYTKSTTRSGAGSLVPQEEINVVNPRQTYYMLTGQDADYDRMAVYYRNLLLQEGELIPKSDSVSLKLEVIGTDVRQESLWKSWKVFTKLTDIPGMVDSLQADAVNQVDVVLRQYTQKNKAGAMLSDAVGSLEELNKLNVHLQTRDHRLFVHLAPVQANIDQVNLRLNTANTMGKSPIVINRQNPSLVYPVTYFYRPDYVAQQVYDHLKQYPGLPLALDQLGNHFYGDYTTGQQTTRMHTQANFLNLISELSSHLETALYSPVLPAWCQAIAFYDMPLVGGQYLYEDDTVPFLPILLKGSLPMYVSPLNVGNYTQERLLRMIEYGVNPGFIVTQAPSEFLAYTPLEDYFSTNFNDWRGDIASTWQYLSKVLQMLSGAHIIHHDVPKPGLVRVEYDNGLIVLINYTDDLWEYQGTIISPLDFSVIKDGK